MLWNILLLTGLCATAHVSVVYRVLGALPLVVGAVALPFVTPDREPFDTAAYVQVSVRGWVGGCGSRSLQCNGLLRTSSSPPLPHSPPPPALSSTRLP